MLSVGDFTVLVTRPISAVLLAVVAVLLLALPSPAIMRRRADALTDAGM